MHACACACLCVCICVYAHTFVPIHTCMCHPHVWRIEKKLPKSVLPLHSVSSEDRTQLTHLFIGDLLC